MTRPLVTAILAALAALGLVLWRSPTSPGLLRLIAAAAIAGLPAAAVTIMRESVIEDLLKAGIAIVIGASLLWRGGPVWLAWPLMVGPLVGMLGVNRVTERRGAGSTE